MTDKLIRKIKTADGEYQIDYNSLANLPEAGSSIEGYIPHGTIIEVPVGKSIQAIFDSLEGKFCPGTVVIQLGEGIHDIGIGLNLNKMNQIRQIHIAGAGVDKTTLKKTSVQNDYEMVLFILQQNRVAITDLTIEGEMTKRTIGLHQEETHVTLENVKIRNCGQAWIQTFTNGYTQLYSNITLENDTKNISHGIMAMTGGTNVVYSSANLSIKNTPLGFLSEIGGQNLINYAAITWSGVTTQYKPTLNSNYSNSSSNLIHSANIGIES